MNLKDRRVDRLLGQAGIMDAWVFYAPAKLWGLLHGMLIPAVLPFLAVPDLRWGLLLLLAVMAYLTVSYLLFAREAYSVALQPETICFVNPNRPFKRLRLFDRVELVQLRIEASRPALWKRLFIGSSNQIVVERESDTFRFGCAGLDIDAFDENFTEKTLDDLYRSLLDQGYPIAWMLAEPPL